MARRNRSFFFDNKTGKLESDGKVVVDATNTTNILQTRGSTTGNPVTLSAIGDDTNIDINIDPKGSGEVNIAAGNLNYAGTAITATGAEINILDGVTSTTAELNLLDGVTGTLVTEAGSQTLTNKTLTSPSVNTEAKMLAQAELEFYDSDSSNYVSFRGPATIATNITWTLPNTDGTEGQVLSTNGAGTLAWADAGEGGGSSGSSYPNSTFSTVPGSDGDFDMSYNVAQTSQETPFEDGGTDAFGVNLGSVFSLMDPIGSLESIDYGDGEAYVGA